MKDCKHKLTTMPSGKEICQKCGLDFTSIKIKELEAENERLKGEIRHEIDRGADLAERCDTRNKHITALQSQLAKYEWRSVEDGPEVGDWIWAVKEGEPESLADLNWHGQRGYTHWMPIPGLPEPKKEIWICGNCKSEFVDVGDDHWVECPHCQCQTGHSQKKEGE